MFSLLLNASESFEPMISSDAVILGILILFLAFVFYTSSKSSGPWKKFYAIVPSLLMCYLLPSLLTTFGIIDPEESDLYYMASRYLLPASLALLTLGIDFKGIIRLGPKAIIMFLAGTVGIIAGGIISLLFAQMAFPDKLGEGADAIWRGMSTIAGSWIGGGANQTAMKEIFQPSADLFTIMAVIDVIVANIWMGVILYGVGISTKVDRWFKADNSMIEDLKERMKGFQAKNSRIPSTTDIMIICAIGFGAMSISHFLADYIGPFIAESSPELKRLGLGSSFFWIVFFATTIGLIMSFTKLRTYEGAGASKFGSVFLYVLVATIGTHMDLTSIGKNPEFFLIGIVWIITHITILLITAKIIKAPFFFTAVGSQANVGGAASAPVVASAFHPSLASVGVLLAVLGYAVGTYGAWLCGILMQGMSN